MKITRIIAAMAFALLLSQGSSFAAKLYISEYVGLGSAPNNDRPQVAKEPAVVDQAPIDFTGGATPSIAFGASTNYVRIICDVQCSVKFGPAPVATNANKPLAAMTPEYFGVNPGDKISVIVNP